MILVNLFMHNSKDHEVFDTRIKDVDFSPLNMDKVRMFIISYLPNYLVSHFYSISVVRKNKKTNINVHFEYNKDIVRDLNISKVLND